VTSQSGRHPHAADWATRAPFTVDEYLAQVADRMPGPARTRAAILAELRADLLDAVEAHRRTGLASAAAEQVAVDEFGDPLQLAAAFRAELATAKARRLALLLLASAPLIVLAWAAAAIGSHLGARHALPWQWETSPAWRLTLLVAAAALVIGLFAATAAVAVSGRMTRWLPDCASLAAPSAITAGIAAGAVDLILLLLLARQLAHAPATLDATPVTIAALASITRLAFAKRSIRHSRPLQTTSTW
jgi:HAAS domain-containing protein